jgi:hypothetical protein
MGLFLLVGILAVLVVIGAMIWQLRKPLIGEHALRAL